MSKLEPGLAERLAEWIVHTPSGLADPTVLYWTKQALLDYLGVTLAAVDSDESATVAGLLTHDDQWRDAGCAVIGLGGYATPSGAALANGSLGHIHDFDDLSDTMVGHPSVTTLPAILAAAATHMPTGRELLDAYLVAFEIASKLGLAFNYTQTEKGWHTTATLGVFGATAGVCRLAKTPPNTVINALGIAASFAAGLKVNFGTITKPLHVGRASQSGLVSAQLALLGAESRSDVFEDHQGYGMVFNGEGNFDLSATDDVLGKPWEMVDPGVAFKLYPSCGGTHSAIDAALDIRHQLENGDDIESAVIYLHPRRLKTVDRPMVRSRFDRKFSVQYVTALALARGSVQLRDFTEGDAIPADIAALYRRITARPMPEDRWGPEHFAAEIEVETRAGRHIEHRVEKARGRGPKLAATEEERLDKFRNCAAAALSNDQVEPTIRLVLELEDASSDEVGVLLQNLIGKPRSTGQGGS